MIIKQSFKNNAERNQLFLMGLKPIEVDAIMTYKDLTYPQSYWDYKPYVGEKPYKLGMNCFMINGGLRKTLLQPLTPHDRIQISRLTSLMNSAIDKVKVKRPITLIRGYTNPSYILRYKKGDSFFDEGFTSTSENKTCAENYALKNPNISIPVISICEIPTSSNAIYLGKDEKEWLLKNNRKFTVTDISDDVIGDKLGLIYYLRTET